MAFLYLCAIMNIFKKTAAVFLAAIFLFSSLGLTISSMVCLKSGKEKVSLVVIEDCCIKNEKIMPVAVACCADEKEELPLSQKAFLKEDDCCDINNFAIKLNDFKNAQKLSVEQPAVLNTLFASAEITPSASSEITSAFHYTDLPPPFYGRTLLNFISTLII